MLDEQSAPGSVTFEELEQQIAASGAGAAKPKLADIKLDSDDVPAELKGKSVAELLQLQKGLSDSLRLSEERRTQLEAAAKATPAPAAPVEPAPKEEPELTQEELKTLHEKDPLAAIQYMQARSDKRAEENLNRRLSTLVTGSSQSAENAARAKYPDEFALFGDQITAALNSGLVKKEAMAQPQAWDDLISWIRGKPANIDKLFEHRVEKAKKGAQDAAQQEQAAGAGTSVRSTQRPPPPSSGDEQMDDWTKEIARTLFSDLPPEQAYVEYNKWKKVS